MMPQYGIAGDRRADRRYDIELEVRWKLIRRRKVLASGKGRTIDLSSGGVRLDAGQELRVGFDAELSITWPVLLNSSAPLQLLVAGRIQRCQGTQAAIRIVHHEFRTLATASGQRRAPQQAGPVLLAAPGSWGQIQ